MSFGRKDIKNATGTSKFITSVDSNNIYQDATTFTSCNRYACSNQWVYTGKNYKIDISRVTELLTDDITSYATLYANIYKKYSNKELYSYTIGYELGVSNELSQIMLEESTDVTNLINIDNIKLGSERVYGKTLNATSTNSISATHKNIGIITIIFLNN